MVAHLLGEGLGAGCFLAGGGRLPGGQVRPGQGDADVGFVAAVAAVCGVAERFA